MILFVIKTIKFDLLVIELRAILNKDIDIHHQTK